VSRADLDARLVDALDALNGWARSDVSDADERAREARGRVLLTVDAIVAAAETSRDVAWVIALDSQCGGADVDDGIACATAEALRVTERVARRLLDGTPTTDEQIAAAIDKAREVRS